MKNLFDYMGFKAPSSESLLVLYTLDATWLVLGTFLQMLPSLDGVLGVPFLTLH